MHTPVCATAALGPERLRALQFGAVRRLAEETGEAMSAMLPFARRGRPGADHSLAAGLWRDWY